MFHGGSKMIELENSITLKLFEDMLDEWISKKDGFGQIWDAINSVKQVPVIPGLNILTIYQVAEYFSSSYQSIKRIYQKFIQNSYAIRSYNLGANTLKEFAVSWETLQNEDGKRIRIDYPKFSIMVPPSCIICFPAIEIITFICKLTQNTVNSKIIEALIRSSPRNGAKAPQKTNGDRLFEMLVNNAKECSVFEIKRSNSAKITITVEN